MSLRIRPRRRAFAAFVAWSTVLAVAVASAGTSSAGARPTPRPLATGMAKRVCSTVTRPGWASCLSVVRTDVAGHKGLYAADATPGGYGPNDLQDALRPAVSHGRCRQTVAIVDAFDDPNAEADLQVYRAQYGLPECTHGQRLLQQGQPAAARPAPTRLPIPAGRRRSRWTSTWSAPICPSCHILLVEANDNQHRQPRHRPSTPPWRSARSTCRTATAAREDPSRDDARRGLLRPSRAWPSRRAPATAATASPTRPRPLT